MDYQKIKHIFILCTNTIIAEKDVIYLYEKLLEFVIIIKPITLILSDEEDDKDE
jgi:hypothetical protein